MGAFFSLNDFRKVSHYKAASWNQALHEVPWFSAAPQDLSILIGGCEFPGGVGLILPAMSGFKPKLTPFAAFGLTLVTDPNLRTATRGDGFIIHFPES